MFIEQMFKKEKTKLASLQYIFCSDNFLLGLNESFLRHDTFTDIITFDLSSKKAKEGEVYISVDRVRDNAVQFDTQLQEELQRVIFHGALHLCGYKDKTKDQKVQMRSKEDYYLARFRENVSRETKG